MKLEQLEQIIQICQWNNLTTAAQYLFMTQQNLSRSIQSLENELGITIFQRSNKGVCLTDDGKLLYQFALDTVQAHQKMCNSFSTAQVFSKEAVENLNIAYSSHLHLLFPPLFHNLKIMNHNIIPNSEILTIGECFNTLQNNQQYDLVFLQDDTKSLSKTNFSNYYHQYNLFTEKLILICNKNNPITQYKTITAAMLPELPIHTFSAKHGISNLEYTLNNNNIKILPQSKISHFSTIQTLLSFDQGFFIGVPSIYDAFDFTTKKNISYVPIDISVNIASVVYVSKEFANTALGKDTVTIFNKAYRDTIIQVY